MKRIKTNIEIFTIGHSNVSSEKILKLLEKYSIQILFDVRRVPYSGYNPQFNRETFQKILDDKNIQYRFAGECLGGRPNRPYYYKNGNLLKGKNKSLKVVDWHKIAENRAYKEGIRDLMKIAAKQRTIIMCSEEDPLRCHRHHLITQTLLEMGVCVRHIRKHGTIESAELEIKKDFGNDEKNEQLKLFKVSIRFFTINSLLLNPLHL